MSGGLGGTGLVADDLYLMAHHETSGRPFLQPRPMGIGLAGAQLAELMLGGCVFTADDGAVTAGRSWPGDDLARKIRDQIAAESGRYSVTDWLLFLGQSATPNVAVRLERAGYLTQAGGRGAGGGAPGGGGGPGGGVGARGGGRPPPPPRGARNPPRLRRRSQAPGTRR